MSTATPKTLVQIFQRKISLEYRVAD